MRLPSTTPVTVVSHRDRVAAGLHHWVDGTFGIDRHDGATTVIAPNGPVLSRHRLDRGGFLAGLCATDEEIEGIPAQVHHASGGALHRDEASGLVLMTYHGESFEGDDAADYWAFIGLAASRDGERFVDLGPIVTSDLADDDPHRPRPLDVGPGSFIVRDGWMCVYFQDRGIGTFRQHLSVARARVDEVVAEALQGRAASFAKLDGGRWSSPGLGGSADDLLAGAPYPVLWFDVAHLRRPDLVLVVYSTVERVASGGYQWCHVGVCSSDGVRFGAPAKVGTAMHDDEMLYVTIDSTGPVQRAIDDDWFHLYRVRAPGAFRWDDACLERAVVRVQLDPGDGDAD